MNDEGDTTTDLTAVLREILLGRDPDPDPETWRREYRRQIAETGRGVAQYSDPAGE